MGILARWVGKPYMIEKWSLLSVNYIKNVTYKSEYEDIWEKIIGGMVREVVKDWWCVCACMCVCVCVLVCFSKK